MLFVEVGSFEAVLGKLEDRSVDLVLTDPPYNISKTTGFANLGENSVERFAVNMDFGVWDHSLPNVDLLASEAFRVLRDGGSCVIFFDIWKLSTLAMALEKAGFCMLRLVIWQKSNPVPLNMKSTYLSNSREIAISAVKKGKPTFNGEYHNGVFEFPIPRHGGKRVHPTQKSLDLFSELVRIHSNEGDLVVDPFVGSGTTGVAALSQGRRFVGGDIDSFYVEAANRWLLEVVDEVCDDSG